MKGLVLGATIATGSLYLYDRSRRIEKATAQKDTVFKQNPTTNTKTKGEPTLQDQYVEAASATRHLTNFAAYAKNDILPQLTAFATDIQKAVENFQKNTQGEQQALTKHIATLKEHLEN